jgi:adenylate cyclase
LSLAEKFDHAGLKIQAHHANWATSFVSGKLAQAHAHAKAALQLFEPAVHHAMASSYGNHDAGCCARNFAAMSLALRDDEAGARALVEQSLAVVRTLGDPFSLSLTLFFTSAVAQMLGDVSLASANSLLSVQMATEHDLAQPKAWGMSVAGWCAVEKGDVDHGLALGTQAIVTMQTIHSRHFLVYMLGLLADSQLKAGRHPEAMKAVDEALTLADATGECFYDAELHRLRGELLAYPHADPHKAEASFRAAIDVARRQGANTLERRAEASLARWCS